MTPYRYLIADVFTTTAFGGNQLAVFPDARGLSDRTMQALAREFNFPETTFVLPSRGAGTTRRLRIFTPRTEVPFAGHPTVGTAAVLVHERVVPLDGDTAQMVLEEGVGPIALEVSRRDGVLWSRFTVERGAEIVATGPSRAVAAATLSVPVDAIIDAWFASAGLAFCFVRLDSPETVDRAVLDRSAWTAHFTSAPSSNVFLFAGDVAPGNALHARMFAPAFGIEEDPATGSACAALAGTLAERATARDGVLEWRINQGVSMGRPSAIDASAEKRNGVVERIRIGGATMVIADGTIAVPDGS